MYIEIDEEALENMKMLLGEQFEETVIFCCSEFERLESELMLNLTNDKDAAIRHAPSFKSNALQFGAKSLSEVDRTIEHGLTSGDEAATTEALDKLAHQVAGSKTRLQQWLAA